MIGVDLNLMHAVESVSRLVADSFVSGLWQGIVLAAGVALCLRLVPRTTAAVRFAIWTVVFAILAVMPLVHAYTSGSGGGTSGRGAVVQLDVRWTYAIAALWLMASLVRAVKLAMSAVRLRGIWNRAVPVEGGDAVLAAAGFRRVELCTSRDVDRPSVIGFFSPRILIPEELFARLTTEEFGQIVLHEVGHLRRADDWINLLQKLSLVLVPLNPVLMWIERQLCLERELACDDGVLRLTQAPKAYATCLTNLAEHRIGRRAAALSLGAWERKSELARRVHSILLGGKRMGVAQARVVMTVVVVGLLGGSAELARCPRLVSFSPSALPMAAAAQSSSGMGLGTGLGTGPQYVPVTFRGSANAPGAAHESLLKATMAVDTGRSIRPARAAAVKHRRAVAAPALQRSRENRAVVQQKVRGWVVLTSWGGPDGPERQGMVLSGSLPEIQERGIQKRVISISYAAVSTGGGWLVIQL
jgi:beta-lactamase regulating signal transducer with metallopeptidase domain